MTHALVPSKASASSISSIRQLPVTDGFWLAGSPPRRLYQSLHGHHCADVAIVGGGITGATIAALFAAAGIAVALVEAGHVGAGSTAVSTALLLKDPDRGLLDLARLYGRAAAGRIWQLCHQSARGLASLLTRQRIACDFRRRDALYFAARREDAGPLRAEHERRAKAGFAGVWLDREALRRAAGIDGYGAIRTGGNAQLDPYRACLGLLGAARQDGAEIFESSPVSRISPTSTGVRVHAGRGSVEARTVIVATGYATRYFKPLAGRFHMNHTYVLATRPVSPRRRAELPFDDVMAWDTDSPYHYARWAPDGRLLLGGADRPIRRGTRRQSRFAEAARELHADFMRLLPGASALPLEYGWEGVFASTPDGLPYIGPHRRYPRHLFALGYGGNGMTFGFLAARLLLEHWQGRESSDHRLFTFDRLR